MKRVFNSDKSLIAILCLIALGVFFLTYGSMGNLYVDCGREAYIPWQMLKGEVLYKDIFNIYAPGAYYINALLFKIFSPHLHVLLSSAMFVYAGITVLLYLIARFFLSRQNSFVVSICILLTTSLSGNVFNFYYPYSYAVIYGLLAALSSLYFLIRRKSDNDYYLAAFFAGVAVINKYEFIPFVLPLFYFIITQTKSVKKFFYATVFFCIVPIAVLFLLLWQGLTFWDITKEVLIIKEILSSECFKYFYSISGIKFSLVHIPLLLGTLAVFLFSVFVGLRLKNKFLKYTLIIFVCVLLKHFYMFKLFVFVPFLIMFLFIARYRKLSFSAKILGYSYFAIALKVLSSLMLFSYGMYFLGLSLVVLLVLLPIKYRKICLQVLFILSLLMFKFGAETIENKVYPITTPNGIVYSMEILQKPFVEVYDYLAKNTTPSDKILAFPEMPLLNFLLKRDNDNYLYSLIPMYIEVFGEEHIIGRIEETNAEYIVINNFDMSSYGFRIFGEDYAFGIMDYINQNYNKVFETKSGLKHVIYRRK